MENSIDKNVLVIGAGLAGSDAAYFLAENGVKVTLVEVKRKKKNPAQTIDGFGELVCTNSLKSQDPHSGHGLLKHEMESMGSLVLDSGRKTSVPAGNALAVDREKFSELITEKLSSHPNITIVDEEITDPLMAKEKYKADYVIVSTGPLTTDGLTTWIEDVLTKEDLHFYDAIAPIVDADSLDYEKMYFKDRYQDIEEGKVPDYLNAPMNKEEYESFIDELLAAKKVPMASFEKVNYFESCLPVDLMAERGRETLRFGPMKPVGLAKDLDGEKPYAVIQLRRENLQGDAFNLVGFQNRLLYGEQVRVFKMIPGFENAKFLHLGSVHRNTFLHSKNLLNFDFSSKEFPAIHFAGQITGVEGYTESASMGLYVGYQILRKLKGMEAVQFPIQTAMGALVNYVMTAEKPRPTNINFGLLPSVPLNKEQRKMRGGLRKKLKKEIVAKKANASFDEFYKNVVINPINSEATI